MNKTSLISLVLAILMLSTACNNKTSSKNDNGTTNSLSDVDNSVSDSSDEFDVVEVSVIPTEILTLKPGKKDLAYVPESSYMTGTWTMEVTNTGSMPVQGSDYDIAYVEVIEEWVGSDEDGGFEDVDQVRTQSGVDVGPNQTVKIVLKASSGCQDMKSPKIINASNITTTVVDKIISQINEHIDAVSGLKEAGIPSSSTSFYRVIERLPDYSTEQNKIKNKLTPEQKTRIDAVEKKLQNLYDSME